jgi:predicted alpha/beta-fold hydrolase
MILVESHDTKLFHMKIPFLRNVDLGAAVPTFILSATDDPSVFPQEKSIKGGRRAPLKMVRTNHGGPLGYIFCQPEHAFGSRRAASWMPMELALFI